MLIKEFSKYFFLLPIFILFFISYNVVFISFGNFSIFCSIAFALACITIKNFIYKDFNFTNIRSYKEFYTTFFIFLAYSTLTTLGYWLYIDELNIYTDTHAPMGSIETGQYANIANYISENDYIPGLKKNYAQSIIAGSLNLLKVDPALSLSIILILVKTYTLSYLFMFLRDKYSIINSLLITLGFSIIGISLSRFSVLPIDSGFPFIAIGYFDTAFSILTFLIYMYLHHFEHIKFNLFYRFMFYLSWIVYAPQNFILIFMSFILNFKKNKRNVFVMSLIFFYATITCGFFLSTQSFESSLISGLVSPEKESDLHIFFGADVLIFKPEIYPSFVFEHLSSTYQWITEETFKSLALKFLFVLKYFFVIFLFIFIYFFGKYFNWKKKFTDKHVNLVVLSSIIIFIMILFIDINNFKWQLQRFFIPTIFISILYVFYNTYISGNNYCKIFVACIFTISSIGNILAIASRVILLLQNKSMFSLINKLINSG